MAAIKFDNMLFASLYTMLEKMIGIYKQRIF